MQTARTRARRRLIGAAVLVGIGIVAFPLVFETRPRPIDVGLPIEIPSKDSAPPLAPPRADAPVSPASPPSPPSPAPVPAAPADEPPAASAANAPAPATPTPTPAAAPAKTAPERAAPPRSDEQRRDAQRAQELLEGKTPADDAAAAKAPRFVVQAGAYAEAAALRDARRKVEKLGLKTYIQVIDNDGVKQTRVRVGPFGSRDDAEKAAARIRSAGLPVSILVL